jgi:4-nitrophenyl phosphatase
MVERNGNLLGWPAVKGIISDLDGVVYRGEAGIRDAIQAFNNWERTGIPYAFVTNNSTRSPEDVAEKLRFFGVTVTPGRIVTSSLVAAQMMKERWPPRTPVFVIGAPALNNAIAAAGFEITDRSPEVIVMGLDRNISHRKLCVAVDALLAGATLIGTNPDLLLPTANGFELGAGAMLTAVSAATRVRPIVLGKPEPHMIETALQRLGTPRESTLMIGDQVATDIQAGKRTGLYSVLVTTGVAEREEPGLSPPDIVIDSLTEIPT